MEGGKKMLRGVRNTLDHPSDCGAPCSTILARIGSVGATYDAFGLFGTAV
jgi:hypothetical protein